MNTLLLYPPEPWCQELLRSLGVEGVVYNGVQELPEIEVLVLIEAFQCQGQAYSLARLWQTWLLHKSPKTRIVVFGWQEATHFKGYIDLLASAPQQKLPLFQAIVAKEALLPTNGLDAEASIKRLVDGHGNDSLLKGISRLLSFIDTLLFIIEDQGDNSVWEQQQGALLALITPLQHLWDLHGQKILYTPLEYSSNQARNVLNSLQQELPSLHAASTVLQPLFQVSSILTEWQQWLNK